MESTRAARSVGVGTSVVLVLLALAGCGGGPDRLTSAEDDIIEASCARLVRCGVFESTAACVATFDGGSFKPTVRAAFDRGEVVVAEAELERCVAAMAGLACDLQGPDALAVACGGVLAGTFGDGEACVLDLQCASGECLKVTGCVDACCEGECAARAGLGEPCDQRGCEPGLDCLGEVRTCVLPRGAGEACGAARCASPLVCVPTEGGEPVCRTPFQEGEACTFPSFRPTVCESPALRCVALSVEDGRACERLRFEGDDCAGLARELCRPGLVCDRSTEQCAEASRVGESCRDRSCADGLRCDYENDLCAELLADGASCDLSRDCASGMCAFDDDDVADGERCQPRPTCEP